MANERQAGVIVVRELRKIDVDKVMVAAAKRVAAAVKVVTVNGLDPGWDLETAAREDRAAAWLAAETADHQARAVWEILDQLRKISLLGPTFVESGRHMSVPACHRFSEPWRASIHKPLSVHVALGSGPGVYTGEEAARHLKAFRETPDEAANL